MKFEGRPKKISNLYQFERVHTLQNVGKLNSFNKNFQNFFTIKIFSVAVRSEKIWTTSVYHNFLKYPKKSSETSRKVQKNIVMSVCPYVFGYLENGMTNLKNSFTIIFWRMWGQSQLSMFTNRFKDCTFSAITWKSFNRFEITLFGKFLGKSFPRISFHLSGNNEKYFQLNQIENFMNFEKALVLRVPKIFCHKWHVSRGFAIPVLQVFLFWDLYNTYISLKKQQ